ncbi:hypothetical protein KC678_00050 [Candidatus Dojkabacteria bacterium]|uniref:Uncharacterized protein n=1 Tax=Candidatus Dojkabacteria bacterium TaxID=2099670 RepID=A0A955L1F4_9BACT|nr:hypothetical protein [Candidatus Dojkabacteria bacterium]
MKKLIEYISNIAKFESALFQNNFSAQSYLHTYYPDKFDINEYLNTSKILYNLFSKSNSLIEINSIKEETNLREEEIENIAILNFLEKVVIYLLGKNKNNFLVLDVGGGPTIYQHIFNSLIAKCIIHTDFLEENRAEVIKWRDTTEGSYSWLSYIDLVKKIMESSNDINLKNYSKNIDTTSLRSRLKRKLKFIKFGDVFDFNLGLDEATINYIKKNKGVDLLTSNFTVESATSSTKRWVEGMINIINFVKVDGYISISAISNAYWYQVGTKKLPAAAITLKDLTQFLKKHNFEIIFHYNLHGSEKEKVGYDGMLFVFARKVK